MNEVKAYERFVRTKLEAEIDNLRRALGQGAGLGDLPYHAQLVGKISGLEFAKDILKENTSVFLKEQLDD